MKKINKFGIILLTVVLVNLAYACTKICYVTSPEPEPEPGPTPIIVPAPPIVTPPDDSGVKRTVEYVRDTTGGHLSVTDVFVGGATVVIPGDVDIVLDGPIVRDDKGNAVKTGCAIEIVCKDENIAQGTIEYIRSQITDKFYHSKAYNRYITNSNFTLVVDIAQMSKSSNMLSARIVSGSSRVVATSMVIVAADLNEIPSACQQLINKL